MFICMTMGLIFVHVYKTGGTSIASVLESHLTPWEHRVHRLGRCRNGLAAGGQRRGLTQHSTACEIRDRLPRRFFARSFKFAFVRNPWSLQLSLYRHVLRSPDHPQHALFRALPDFEAYIEWLATLPNGPHRVQRDFVTDESGRILVDFIGRFERLERDFATVASRFGWPTRLPHLNGSDQDPDYRKFYSPRMRDIVARLHQADIAAFGYDF